MGLATACLGSEVGGKQKLLGGEGSGGFPKGKTHPKASSQEGGGRWTRPREAHSRKYVEIGRCLECFLFYFHFIFNRQFTDIVKILRVQRVCQTASFPHLPPSLPSPQRHPSYQAEMGDVMQIKVFV